MTPEELKILSDVIDAANSYAAYTCGEFCVHGTDPPSDCPYADVRIKAATVLFESQMATAEQQAALQPKEPTE